MAMFEIHAVDEQIKALPTTDTADSVSINQWDEQWETGSIDNVTGQNNNLGTNRIKSKNYIPVLPNVSYNFVSLDTIFAMFLYYYDKDKNFLYIDGNVTRPNYVFTTPANCYYIRFRSNDNFGVYDNSISINYPSTDTEYHANKHGIATFDTDLTENLIEVKCQIVAQQSGSGTPSPSNPRPITTFSEMNVSHSGKNIFDKGLLIDQVAWNVITLQLKPNTAYTMSSNLPYTATGELPCYFFPSSGSPSPSTMVYSGQTRTLTTESDGIAKIQQRRISGTDSFQNYNWQIELGSRETTYEPYNGTTANIPFGQTVAQGVLNVGTGKLEITKGFVNMWELGWILSSSGYFYADYTPIKANSGWSIVPDLMCTNYQADTPNNIANKITNERISIWPSGHRVVLYDNNYETPTALVTALQNATSQLVFDLDVNPTIVQLDSITLQALLNENNIWCDTGDTEVKYWMSINKYIGQ